MKRLASDIEVAHERASATPERRGTGGVAGKAGPCALPSPIALPEGDDASLRGRQLRFAHSIATSESRPAALDGKDAARWFTAGPRMTANERLEIYRRAYHARLVECLADDYPVTQALLGESGFAELCRAYIARFPSTGPSLNDFGRSMSAFIRDSGERCISPAFVAELVALEWAIVEVIHSPSQPQLTLDGLAGVPAEAWASVRFVATPALRLLRFAYPVNEYFQSHREGDGPHVPEARLSVTVVYRSGPTVWRMDLSEPMALVLSALVDGETLGDALARAEASLSELDEKTMASRVTAWFREWVGHGLFVRALW